MNFDVARAIEEGLSRTATRSGAIFVAAFVALGVVTSLASQSLLQTVFFEELDLEEVFADAPAGTVEEFRMEIERLVTVDVLAFPVETLAAILIVAWLARFVVRIGAMRWFVEEGSGPLRAELFTRRLLWTVGNLVVGAIVYAIAVGVGLLIFVVPGLFAAVALFFFNYEVVVEGENAIDALANSYELTKGNRLELFLLGVLFAVASAILGLAGSPVIWGDPVVATVVGTLVGATIAVVGVGVAAAAYTQLRDLAAEDAPEALGADDL